MSSLLTNTSAMVALQTLKTINKNLGAVQGEISTGKKIANARDNAALWGISTTMQTDVSGFKAISESLSLGDASLTVARDAAETITGLLDKLKGKIVAAQEENVDRAKIQTDVEALRDQILTVVDGAQFNGLNLLDGDDQVNILAALNRDSAGRVTASNISFDKQNLTTTEGTYNTAGTAIASAVSATVPLTVNQDQDSATLTTAVTTGGTFAVRFTATDAVDSTKIRTFDLQVTVADAATAANVAAAIVSAAGAAGNKEQLAEFGVIVTGTGAAFTVNSANGAETVATSLQNGNVVFAAPATMATEIASVSVAATQEEVSFTGRAVAEGDGYRLSVGGANFDYVARKGDTAEDVAAQIALKINGQTGVKIAARLGEPDATTGTVTLYLTNTSGYDTGVGTGPVGADIAAGTGAATTDGVVGGGLENLDKIDVTTETGPRTALNTIERLIQSSISAAAAFGSAQGRMQTQSEFVGKIMDGLTAGIGALVDADMEAASAKLQALQVQQQLGVQALSIANQQPQNILALFR
jgi:flagellin